MEKGSYPETLLIIFSTISCDKNIAMNVDANGNWNGGMSSFYDDVFIDPFGQLFGLSQCGELNFTEHMTL